MASPLENQIKRAVHQGFKGKLLPGTLRRDSATSVDSEYGDPVPGTPSTYSFEGIRDEYSAFYRKQAGIPETDCKVLIIAGSLSETPTKDDKLLLRGQWFQVRKVMGDPAGATHELQVFEIPDPT